MLKLSKVPSAIMPRDAALRRVRIDVVEMLEVGRIFHVAEQRQRMTPDRLAARILCTGGFDRGKNCGKPQCRGKRGDGAALQKMSSGNCQMRNSCCCLSGR